MRALLRLAFLSVALTIVAIAAAQMKNPVQWTGRFEPSTIAPNAWGEVVLEATIDKGWHLYSMKEIPDGPQPTTIKAEGQAAFSEVATATQQKPEIKLDPNFGKEVELYSNTATFRLPVKVSKEASGAQQAVVSVRFMSCNDTTCMPPQTVEVPINFTVAGDAVADAPPPVAAATETPPASGDGGLSPTDRIKGAKDSGLLAFFLLSIGAGFLALLTPCVFPMIPITVSFFAKRRESEGSGSALSQAAAYCLGIIFTFTALGVFVAAIFGASGLQLLAANPWLNLALATLFVLLALNLFGVFEIRLPMGMTNRFSPQGKSRFLAPVMMALAFTITSFTCTLPFVGTLLVAASQGEFFYPIVGMLGFSTAFATPFFLLALFPQALSKMPRGGAWMVVVKAFMGFLELAAAVKFYSNADLVWQLGWLTRPVFLAVWAGIMGVAGLYMMGWLRIPTVDDAKVGFGRRIIGVAAIASCITFLGAINGRQLGELDAFLPPTPYPGQALAAGHGEEKWVEDFEEGLALAREQGKPVFVDFTGVTCTNCRQMEKNVFPLPSVVERFDQYVLVRLFTDRDTAGDRANQKLQEKLTGSVTLPIYVVLSADGKPLKTFEGSTRDIDAFVGFLDAGLQSFIARR